MYQGIIIAALTIVVFIFLGWRKATKPALVAFAVMIAVRIALFGQYSSAIIEQRRLLGLSPIEPSFIFYALQMIWFTAFWCGLGFGVGTIALFLYKKFTTK